MNDEYDIDDAEKRAYLQPGDAAWDLIHGNKCRLCDERPATKFKSPITGKKQYCETCLKKEIKV